MRARVGWPLFAGFICAYFLLLFPPWRFSVPGAGLDPSWNEVIVYAALEHWQWGRDIAFTYGPLGFVSPNRFNEILSAPALFANSLFAVALALGIAALLPRTSVYAGVGFFLLSAYAAATWQHVYVVFGLLATLLHFGEPDRRMRGTTVLVAVAAGVFANVYVASAVFAFAAFLCIDASRLLRRRLPICAPTFVASCIASYAAAGQRLGDLPLFLRSCFELITGYPGAMSIDGNRGELAVFVVAFTVAFALILRIEWALLPDSRRRIDTLLLTGSLGAYGFIMYKTGFVRHDLHSLMAWLGIAFLLSVYTALRWKVIGGRRIGWTLVGLSLATNFAAVFVQQRSLDLAGVGLHAYRALIQFPREALRDATTALSDPERWAASWRERQKAAYAMVRTLVPLPKLEGSIDVIPNIQSSVIAHGMEYRPRPIFQDYAAFTSWLIEQNRAHYRSSKSATYILFRPETIDNRYPLLDQGPAVIELLGYYKPVQIERDLLVLKRREIPRAVELTDSQQIDASLGQWIRIDRGDVPIMLSASITSNLAGRIANVLLRPPVLALTVRLATGREQQYRLINGIVESGILLSPVVDTTLAFAAVAAGLPGAVGSQRVVAFRIDALSDIGRRLYNDVVPVRLVSLRLGSGIEDEAGAELTRMLRRQALVDKIATQSEIKVPFVEAHETELFAHAPARVSLRVMSVSRMRIRFGIRQGAWTGAGATDGVCFRVFATTGDEATRKLMERCLDPRGRPDDQPEQAAEVLVGSTVPTTLVFETACRSSCAWDWSYWKDIDVDP